MYTSLAISQEEQVWCVVPGDLVDLEVGLLLGDYLMSPGVNEGNQVLLIAHGDGVPIRRPGDVDVLALGVDGGGTFL